MEVQEVETPCYCRMLCIRLGEPTVLHTPRRGLEHIWLVFSSENGKCQVIGVNVNNSLVPAQGHGNEGRSKTKSSTQRMLRILHAGRMNGKSV